MPLEVHRSAQGETTPNETTSLLVAVDLWVLTYLFNDGGPRVACPLATILVLMVAVGVTYGGTCSRQAGRPERLTATGVDVAATSTIADPSGNVVNLYQNA
jgi:hypothetical protein